jgi:hypothetical protein
MPSFVSSEVIDVFAMADASVTSRAYYFSVFPSHQFDQLIPFDDKSKSSSD